MSTANKQQLQGLSVELLKKAEDEAREKVNQLSFALANGELKNVREVRLAKKHLARILTYLQQKEAALTDK